MTSHKFIIFLLLMVGVSVGQAQVLDPPTEYGIKAYDFERVAQSGWQFLKLPTDARMAALGNITTVTGINDVNAALRNPAELTGLHGTPVSFTRVNWFADIAYNAMAGAFNLGSVGTIGLSARFLDYGDMKRTEYTTIEDAAAPTGIRDVISDDLGTFGASDMSIGLSYAREVTDRLSVGANLHYIREEIDDLSMSNFAFDVGTSYNTGIKSLRLAMLIRNFGPDKKLVNYNEEIQREPASIKMPAQFRLGAAFDAIDLEAHKVTLAVEGVHINDGPEKVNLGMEYGLLDFIFLRGGYKFNYDEESFSLGAGLNISMGSTFAVINFAYVDFGQLDTVNMFSVALGF